MNIKQALKDYFGFDNFKDNQESIIQSILKGNDTFVLMPTGGGKSLCYQLPAILSKGSAIVISPLIALMKNQVDQMRAYSQNPNIAHFLNSSLTKAQIRKVKEDLISGETKMLYVAPETLTKEENLEFFKGLNVSFVAIDEAHCISEWGHDFRPEYRRIRLMVDFIGTNIPLIALTATATPKVKSDIVKNLGLKTPNIYVSSFNRTNLYYEIRNKSNDSDTKKSIVQFIKTKPGKSGIIYVLSRKSAEEIAQTLVVNGIKAAPYHAGLDPAVRAKTQDDFLMEETDVIVATIAFGMGIDKPDVRFVIHFNIPKSIENYYQETGRAGRDGLEGICITYFNYKDIEKMEKFIRNKEVAKREMGSQLLHEMVAYGETGSCRRQFLLHYFGESYDTSQCNKMCDNCRNPKAKIDVKDDVLTALEVIKELNEKHQIKHIVGVITGEKNRDIIAFSHDKTKFFGKGKAKEKHHWTSVIQNALVQNLIRKDIEQYGILKMTEAGHSFLKNPKPFEISLNHIFEINENGSSEDSGRSAILDPQLYELLKDLRKKVAKEKGVPPYIIFQDPSLEDMAANYPVTTEELSNISGVSKGKAIRYGQKFVKLIEQYVEDNDIDRPVDFTIKSIANKSAAKISIIQNIDRQIPLEDIANQKGLKFEDLLKEIETIVFSGTKINLNYYINDVLDEEQQEIIFDYFMEAENDKLDEAFKELKDEGISYEEIQLMRIKFFSEMAN
ncbi:MAG: DNA helicase RecQ [Chitinophagaceae bacterium]|nr:MAG: DNA helicase RecQ [Chitinophagaceae bacterium]